AALQGAAWARMYATFSQAMPKAEAIDLTFSGIEPCDICVAVDDMQAETDPSVANVLRIGLTPLILPDASEVSVKAPPPLRSRHMPDRARALAGIAAPVETPPPRNPVA